MVEELKDLIKNQSNLKSYKTVPFPAVWSGFITELSQKGRVEPSPPDGQLVYHISASSISPIKATGVGVSETVLDMCNCASMIWTEGNYSQCLTCLNLQSFAILIQWHSHATDRLGKYKIQSN